MSEFAIQNKPTLLSPIASPAQIADAHKEAVAVIKNVLEEGRDYGKINGTNRETLLKAGAERLCIAFGSYPSFEVADTEIDHDRLNEHRSGRSYGLYRYVIRCKIRLRQTDEIIGEGIGSCSTLESKYISRPRDCENTVLKMAEKRAFVAATLHAFGLSDRFTQDVEDMVEVVEYEEKPLTNPIEITKRLGPSDAEGKRISKLCKDAGKTYTEFVCEAWAHGVRTAKELVDYAEKTLIVAAPEPAPAEPAPVEPVKPLETVFDAYALSLADLYAKLEFSAENRKGFAAHCKSVGLDEKEQLIKLHESAPDLRGGELYLHWMQNTTQEVSA